MAANPSAAFFAVGYANMIRTRVSPHAWHAEFVDSNAMDTAGNRKNRKNRTGLHEGIVVFVIR